MNLQEIEKGDDEIQYFAKPPLLENFKSFQKESKKKLIEDV